MPCKASEGEQARSWASEDVPSGKLPQTRVSSTKCRDGMANLERGFRRPRFAFSLLLASRFVVDGVLSFFETGRIPYYLLVPTAIGFVLPRPVFYVAQVVRSSYLGLSFRFRLIPLQSQRTDSGFTRGVR